MYRMRCRSLGGFKRLLIVIRGEGRTSNAASAEREVQGVAIDLMRFSAQVDRVSGSQRERSSAWG